MANKAISELPQALNVNNQDLFVLEQSGIAKKLTAETFITEQGIIDALAEALDGHGGIQSVTLSSVSGRIRTYLITFTDGSATTFQVYDGTTIERIAKTSTSGLVDTYTVFMNDGTTTFFTVTNGADGTVSEAMLNDALKDKAPAITETTESSAIANFTDGADDMVMHNVVAEINPVQDLSNGDPSPTNICPITGHTEVDVTRTGKNLFPIQIEPLRAWATDRQDMVAFMNTLKAGTYALSCVNKIQSVRSGDTAAEFMLGVWPRNSAIGNQSLLECRTAITSSQEVAGFSATSTKTITITEAMVGNFNHFYLYSGDNKGNATSSFDIQLELGSSATAYEAPQVQTVSVDWTTEAGTVYGGTLDVATGLLTVTHVLWSKNTSTMDNAGGGTYPGWSNAGIRDLIGAGLNTAYTSQVLNIGSVFGVNTTSTRDVFLLPASAYSGRTMDDWVALAIDVQCVIPLATPQTYQLTPQEVKTLLGTNNVWADTGNTTVTYPADTKMFIEKLTIPTEDDLVANQAITSGKYFMIGNSLYLALANIASGAQITIGTNAQRVSLADALNAINS